MTAAPRVGAGVVFPAGETGSAEADRRRRPRAIYRLALVGSDVGALAVSYAIAVLAVDESDRVPGVLAHAASLPAWLAILAAYGLYGWKHRDGARSTVDDLGAIISALTLTTFALIVALSTLEGSSALSVPLLAVFWMATVLAVPLFRAAGIAACRRLGAYRHTTVIVGSGPEARRLARKLLRSGDSSLALVGLVDDRTGDRRDGVVGAPVVGTVDELATIVRRHRIDRVIIVPSPESDERLLTAVGELASLDVHVDVAPRLASVLGQSTSLSSVEGVALVHLPPLRLSGGAAAAKRATDVVLAVLASIVLLPVVIAIAIAIRVDSRGPVVYRQTRIGRGDEEFRIAKFRTMVVDAELRKPEIAHLNRHRGADDRMFKVPNDPRVTRVGRLLRRYSLDELPQLWNVLRGEMTLVGPRPLIPEEHVHVVGWARRRLDLKPGITGLWQVLGRDAIPFGEMVALDYQYVTGWSVGYDLRIMLKTVTALRGT